MKKNLILIYALLILPSIAHAQLKVNEFKSATIFLKDSSSLVARIQVYYLLEKNKLIFEEKKSANPILSAINKIVVDSSEYFVRTIKNPRDTVKVIERVVEGKISMYASAFKTSKNELFVEKDGSTYELRQLHKDKDGRTYEVDEYKPYLKTLMTDCSKIWESKKNISYTFGSIQNKIVEYNKNCGWQKMIKSIPRPEKNFGLLAGVMFANSNLYYDHGAFRGHSTSNSSIIGGYMRQSYQKFYGIFTTMELSLEKVYGLGTATDGSAIHRHHYNILESRVGANLYVPVYKKNYFLISVGSGASIEVQLQNKSTYSLKTGTPTDVHMFVSKSDRMNFTPIGNLLLEFKQFGFRYQLVALSLHLKAIETYHFEHRFTLFYKL